MSVKAKKSTVAILAILLVAALTAGATLAFLTQQTEKRVNNFTFAAGTPKSLGVQLVEPEWDGIVDYDYDGDDFVVVYDYDDDGNPIYGYNGNDPTDPIKVRPEENVSTRYDDRPYDKDENNPDTKAPYGDEAALLMTQGDTALKNPFIQNTGSLDAWVAAKMTFVYSTGENAGKPFSVEDFATLMAVIDVSYTNDKWDLVETVDGGISRVFYYTEPLGRRPRNAAPGEYTATQPIFTSVSIKDDADDEDMWLLEELGGFTIYVEGFAGEVQIAANYNAFKTWGKNDGNVIFANTPTDDSPINVGVPIVQKSRLAEGTENLGRDTDMQSEESSPNSQPQSSPNSKPEDDGQLAR